MKTTTLKMTCPDRTGLIATLTQFVFQNNGNIVNLDQHTDMHNNKFFMRIEWQMDDFLIKKNDIHNSLEKFFKKENINSQWKTTFSDEKLRMAIFVSKEDHCLWDILLRHRSGELNCDIPLIISNHNDLQKTAENFDIAFEHVPMSKTTKKEQEQKEFDLIDKYNIDFIVMARYMQILSPNFIDRYPNKIINIHHSFLPAFKGSSPYRQAYKRGVKIIGATAHFATADLDQGPIITQNTRHVSYKDDVQSLQVKGRDIERLVLAKAIKLYIKDSIFIQDNRTLIL